MTDRGVVLHPVDAGAWWHLELLLDRRPARYRRAGMADGRLFAVLYGRDVSAALRTHEVRFAGLRPDEVELVPLAGMVPRAEADMRAGRLALDSSGGTVPCPLCGGVVRQGEGERLDAHPGKEPSAMEGRRQTCPASGETPVGAWKAAQREADELDALRLRAHP